MKLTEHTQARFGRGSVCPAVDSFAGRVGGQNHNEKTRKGKRNEQTEQ